MYFVNLGFAGKQEAKKEEKPVVPSKKDVAPKTSANSKQKVKIVEPEKDSKPEGNDSDEDDSDDSDAMSEDSEDDEVRYRACYYAFISFGLCLFCCKNAGSTVYLEAYLYDFFWFLVVYSSYFILVSFT